VRLERKNKKVVLTQIILKRKKKAKTNIHVSTSSSSSRVIKMRKLVVSTRKHTDMPTT
jgi:hypothetical protein